MSTDHPNVPYGFCHCGCGQRTAISDRTERRHGRIKGEPIRYALGHNGRAGTHGRVTADDLRVRWREAGIEYGLCMCGCGLPTSHANSSQFAQGYVKGEPVPYLPNHGGGVERETASRRLWRKVDKNGPVPAARPDLGPCWIWTGWTINTGYGMIGTGGREGHDVLVHRLSYELLVGPIPDGLNIDHLCSTPTCVNPDHLEAVSQAVNVRRGRRTKLTALDVLHIRAACAAGEQRKVLAARFGVCGQTIADIESRDTWADI